MLGFQGGVSIPLVKGGVKAPPAKRQCRAGPKAGARRGFTALPGMATEVSPLFAGRCGPLWHVECTGLGLPLAARALPTSLQAVVSPAVSSPPPT